MGTSKNQEAASGATVKKRGQFKEIWRRLKKNKMAMIGLGIVALLVLISIFADFLFDYNTVVIKQNTAIRLQTPSAAHWLGTDEFGRDILARLVHGSRVSLSVGVVAVSIALLIGGSLGAIAGFYGGKVDTLIMRFMDVMLAVPSVLLAIVIAAVLGTGVFNLILAIGIASIPSYARIVRASILSIRDQEYIEAARISGCSDARMILRHILPNILAPVIVQTTLGLGLAILNASGLSFLGLGVEAPMPEWGSMLAAARGDMRNYPYLVTFPGIAIVLVVLALNMVGDGLRDALDPRLKS